MITFVGDGFLGITWTEAAIVAASVAGAFTLTKEVLSFFLDRLRRYLDRVLERERLYGRVAQHYFQLAVGAGKALAGFDSTNRSLKALGLPGPLPPPYVDFLAKYDDPCLASDVIALAAEAPDAVSSYLHALNMRKWLVDVIKQETDEFGTLPIHFSYPRTTNALRMLLQHTLAELDAVAERLPKKARGNYRAAARNMTPILDRFPEITATEIVKVSLAARQPR